MNANIGWFDEKRRPNKNQIHSEIPMDDSFEFITR